MTLVVTHLKVSPKPAGSDPTRIYGPDWNNNHVLTGTTDATQLNGNVVQAVVNDTNIQGSINSQALTFSWAGTLAATRLNGNVVQSTTNDTNITGTISAQNLTLGWTGTLAAARLNSNVVQSVTNDTNVTGTISAQNLTLGWTGGLANSRLANMAAYTIKGNATNASAAPTDFTIDSLTLKATPVSTDEVLLWDVSGAAMKKATVSGIAGAAAVSSVNSLTGALTVAGGNGIAVTSASSTITVTQNAPNFKVHLAANQSVTSGTTTKVAFDTVDIDTNSWWDATNKRYTPQQAGNYLFCINISAVGTFTAGTTVLEAWISKNGTVGGAGTALVDTFTISPNAGGSSIPGAHVIVAMNGSTDFVEVDVNIGGTSPSVQGLAAPNIRTVFIGTRISN